MMGQIEVKAQSLGGLCSASETQHSRKADKASLKSGSKEWVASQRKSKTPVLDKLSRRGDKSSTEGV